MTASVHVEVERVYGDPFLRYSIQAIFTSGVDPCIPYLDPPVMEGHRDYAFTRRGAVRKARRILKRERRKSQPKSRFIVTDGMP